MNDTSTPQLYDSIYSGTISNCEVICITETSKSIFSLKDAILSCYHVEAEVNSGSVLEYVSIKIFSYNCVTESAGKLTPEGSYKIDKKNKTLEQAKNYKSGEFAGARMSYPIYIDDARGIAIHGSGLTEGGFNTHSIVAESYIKRVFPGSVGKNLGSHGCIRLPLDDALELYLHTPQGAMVVVRKFWINED